MSAARIERLCWGRIYGGLFLLSLGWFAAPSGGLWGPLLMAGGARATGAGAVLIWVRSRMKE
jgi:hypothetical protein